MAQAWSAGAGPSDDPLTIYLEPTVCVTYGLAKEGAQRHNYAGQRGYHPLLAIAAGAGEPLTVRAKRGFYTHPIVAACRDKSVRFSVTIRQHPSVGNIVGAIPEEDWTPILYWMEGAADVAETTDLTTMVVRLAILGRPALKQDHQAGRSLALAACIPGNCAA